MNVKMFILWGLLFIYGCQTKETLPFLSFETDLKGENNALKIAKKARNNLSDNECINRLHGKYKR